MARTPGTTTTSRKRKTNKKEDVNLPVEKDHVIVQLPIHTDKIKDLIEEDPILNISYCPEIIDPEPYSPNNQFISLNDSLQNVTDVKDSSYKEMIKMEMEQTIEHHIHQNCCYWCCHAVGAKEYGMPIKYDTYYKTFTTFGNFCSLECVAAYNCANHNGSDRMWEIHSWIQMIAHKIGFDTPVRPAPSRYLLKMFNGPLTIDEFRNAHKSNLKTYIMNMPPMIHVPSQMEMLNTSFIAQKNTITTTTESDKTKLSRKRAVVDTQKTLDAKMNLTVKTVEST